MPIKLNGEYATVSEVSDILDCTNGYTKRLLRQGKINGIKIGRDWLVLLNDGQPMTMKTN